MIDNIVIALPLIMSSSSIEGTTYIPLQTIPYVRKYKDDKTIDSRWYVYNAKKRIEKTILDDYKGRDISITVMIIGGELYYYTVRNNMAYIFNKNYTLIHYFQIIKITTTNYDS